MGIYIEGNVLRFGPSGNKNPGIGEYDINDAELNILNKVNKLFFLNKFIFSYSIFHLNILNN